MKGKQESTDPNPPRMKQRTRPHGGRWPACRRSTPGPSTFSSGWHVQPDPAGDKNDPGDAEDGGSSHPKPQNSWQYSLEQVHYSPYEAPAWPTAAPASPPQMLLPALDPSSVTSLSCPQQPLGKERPLSSRPLVGIKVSPHPPAHLRAPGARIPVLVAGIHPPWWRLPCLQLSSVQSLICVRLQHARPPCPSPPPGAYSNS